MTRRHHLFDERRAIYGAIAELDLTDEELLFAIKLERDMHLTPAEAAARDSVPGPNHGPQFCTPDRHVTPHRGCALR